jgi:4-amino-4-deoxychorismate lyase
MQKLLETIKIIDGQPQYLTFHNQRLNTSRKTLFHTSDTIDLNTVIQHPPQKGIYRCRVVYSTQIESIEYCIYCDERSFKRFSMVEADTLIYDFKYLNRSALNKLASSSAVDDIVIVKQGLITDTSIANIAILQNDHWLTPEIPLLQGTTRARLLKTGKMTTASITPKMLEKASKIAIMNALMGFRVLEAFELV